LWVTSTHLRSLYTHPHSPLGTGKSGVKGVSDKGSSLQISVFFSCQD
jgi:hypothetical protein